MNAMRTSYPTSKSYGDLSYTQNIRVVGLKYGCQSFYTETKTAYLETLSTALNISLPSMHFSGCRDQGHKGYVDISSSHPRQQRILDGSYKDSILSTNIVVSLSLYTQTDLGNSNNSSYSFSYLVYQYLGNVCSTSVNNGNFVAIFKYLINGTVDSNNYDNFIFFDAYTSNYTVTEPSSEYAVVTRSVESYNALSTILVAVGAALFLCLLCTGYLLGLWELLCPKKNWLVSDSNVKSVEGDEEVGEFSELFVAPSVSVEIANPMGQEVDNTNSTSPTHRDNDRAPASPIFGPRISLIRHYLKHADNSTSEGVSSMEHPLRLKAVPKYRRSGEVTEANWSPPTRDRSESKEIDISRILHHESILLKEAQKSQGSLRKPVAALLGPKLALVHHHLGEEYNSDEVSSMQQALRLKPTRGITWTEYRNYSSILNGLED